MSEQARPDPASPRPRPRPTHAASTPPAVVPGTPTFTPGVNRRPVLPSSDPLPPEHTPTLLDQVDGRLRSMARTRRLRAQGTPRGQRRGQPVRTAPPASGSRPASPLIALVADSRRRASAVTSGVDRRVLQRSGIAVVFGIVAAGAVLATAAPAATPLAGPAPHARATEPVSNMLPLAPSSSLPPATGQRRALAQPRHAAPAAAADHGVISGLAANGIPSVALNAYRVAAARMADIEPSCGVPWYLLAGIGREESDHGRFGGAVLHADGVSTPKIIGPALDGKVWDRIPAPADGVALDGDAVYAHALGPMQFIPQTWASYAADADGDGKANIFDINDAALVAARYLCAAGGDLHTTAGRTRAVLAYNHNKQYLVQVLALAEAYHKGISIAGIPVGITTGSLPKTKTPKHTPPATTGARHGSSSPTPSRSTGRSSTPSSGSSRPSGTPTSKSSGAPTSSPTPSPTKSCNPIEVAADRLRPPAQRVCAND